MLAYRKTYHPKQNALSLYRIFDLDFNFLRLEELTDQEVKDKAYDIISWAELHTKTLFNRHKEKPPQYYFTYVDEYDGMFDAEFNSHPEAYDFALNRFEEDCMEHNLDYEERLISVIKFYYNDDNEKVICGETIDTLVVEIDG